jgi:hypothetical protein
MENFRYIKINGIGISTYLASDMGLVTATLHEDTRGDGKRHLYDVDKFSHDQHWEFTHCVFEREPHRMIYRKHTKDINHSSANLQKKWELLKTVALMREGMEVAGINKVELV